MAEYSFGGVDFGPRTSELVPLVGVGESLYSVRPIPYSNASVLDLGGINVRRYAVDIRVDPTDAAAIEALYQESEELVVNGVTYPRATLVQLANKSITPRGEWVFYQAEWIVG